MGPQRAASAQAARRRRDRSRWRSRGWPAASLPTCVPATSWWRPSCAPLDGIVARRSPRPGWSAAELAPGRAARFGWARSSRCHAMVRDGARATLFADGALAADMESAWLADSLGDVPLAVVRTIGRLGDRGHGVRRVARVFGRCAGCGRSLEAWAAGGRLPAGSLLAAPRSFCAGVERAIEIVERALDRFGAPVYVRRQIVHNAHVVARARAAGARSSSRSSTRCPTTPRSCSAAHGVSPEVRAQAAAAARPLGHRRHLPARGQGPPRGAAVRGPGPAHRAHRPRRPRGGGGHARRGARRRIDLVETVADVHRLPYERETPLAYLTQTTLAIDETAEIVAALRGRFRRAGRPQRERHLLRHSEPPGRGACPGAPVRPDARRRLGQLLQHGPPRRGGPPGGVPGRAGRGRRPARAGLAGRCRAWLASPRGPRPPSHWSRSSSRRWVVSGRSRSTSTGPPKKPSASPSQPRCADAHPFPTEPPYRCPPAPHRLKKQQYYPFIVEIEPLFACNLSCPGCGKIQHPTEILRQRLSVEDVVGAVEESGTPMVSIAGGEPLLHPDIDRMVQALDRPQGLRLPVHQRRAAGAGASTASRRRTTSPGSSTWTAWASATTPRSTGRASSTRWSEPSGRPRSGASG